MSFTCSLTWAPLHRDQMKCVWGYGPYLCRGPGNYSSGTELDANMPIPDSSERTPQNNTAVNTFIDNTARNLLSEFRDFQGASEDKSVLQAQQVTLSIFQTAHDNPERSVAVRRTIMMMPTGLASADHSPGPSLKRDPIKKALRAVLRDDHALLRVPTLALSDIT
ncbi:hypothetical protein V496_02451 [Pseudogymnoascus sp. VKM F-4515 (FW-2607)]|nr:hypothetical protein V496_02451 [Pseudogymnoascus sp. VKM F-4515 (FW-2607)]